MTENKVFNIELCKEDAERILNALNLLKDNHYQSIQSSDDEQYKEVTWLEWSYVSELMYYLGNVLDADMW